QRRGPEHPRLAGLEPGAGQHQPHQAHQLDSRSSLAPAHARAAAPALRPMSAAAGWKKYVDDCRSFPGDAARAWRSGGAAGVWLELRRRTIDRAGSYVHYLVLEADLSTLRAIPMP